MRSVSILSSSASFGSSASAASYAATALREILLRFVDVADEHLGTSVGRLELRSLLCLAQGRIQITLPTRDVCDFPVEERAFWRRGDGPVVEAARILEPVRLGRFPCIRDVILQPSDAQYLDAGAQGAEARVRDDGGFEALERHVALAEPEQRLASAHERRNVARIGDDRAIEVRSPPRRGPFSRDRRSPGPPLTDRSPPRA